jgi:hypothetical protein
MLKGFERLRASSAAGTRPSTFLFSVTFVEATVGPASPALPCPDRDTLFIVIPFF